MKSFSIYFVVNFLLFTLGMWLLLVTIPSMLIKRNCLEYPQYHQNASRQFCIAQAKASYTFYHADFTANGKHYAWNHEIEMYEEIK